MDAVPSAAEIAALPMDTSFDTKMTEPVGVAPFPVTVAVSCTVSFKSTLPGFALIVVVLADPLTHF